MKELTCQKCNKKFLSKWSTWHAKNGRKKYCSRECSALGHRRRKTINCLSCNKEFLIHLSRKNRAKYCSKKCHMSGSVGPNGFWLDKKRPDLKNTNSAKTMFKSEQVRGANNKNWQGGITKINWGIRHTSEYLRFRQQVLERDNHLCVLCGVSNQVMHVDHIKPFSRFPELRMDIDNARTLCVECHKKTPTWGGKALVVEVVMPYV